MSGGLAHASLTRARCELSASLSDDSTRRILVVKVKSFAIVSNVHFMALLLFVHASARLCLQLSSLQTPHYCKGTQWRGLPLTLTRAHLAATREEKVNPSCAALPTDIERVRKSVSLNRALPAQVVKQRASKVSTCCHSFITNLSLKVTNTKKLKKG